MADQFAKLKTALADHYQIDPEVGAGGMATVYLAHDLKHDLKVARKILRPELSEYLGADRFVAEIRTTPRLRHAHPLYPELRRRMGL